MSKEDVVRSIIFILVFAIGMSWVFHLAFKPMEKTIVTIGEKSLYVYVAQTDSEREQGLSGVEFDEFDADGMLFVFDDQAERTFWMKDMLFDLDVLWIKDGRIVKIDESVPAPEDGDVAYMYSKPHEVDAVLELPYWSVDIYDFYVGQKVYLY